MCRCKKGFTLIEVLVAVGILAIITVLIYGTVSQSHAVSKRLEATSEKYRAVRQTFQILLDDLTGSYYLEQSAADQNPIAVFIGQSPGTMDSFSTGQPLLRFTVLGHQRLEPDSPETDLSLIEYQIHKDADDNLLTLLRREETNPLSTTDASLEEYDLAEGLKELKLRFFDGANWSDAWDSTAKKDVPQAVEVRFVVPIENEDREFSFTARIPTAKPFSAGVIRPTGAGKPQ